MSEELGTARGDAAEPRPIPFTPPILQPQISPSVPTASNSSPTQPRQFFSESSAAASSASGKRSVPGGGSALASGDKPGDPFATLLVLAADAILGKPFTGPIPPMLNRALDAIIQLVEAAPRCVVVVAGGPSATQSLMTQIVLRMPGGLDAFGPGKRVEALLKEKSAAWGSLFDSALLVKALAKRQASTVRFGSVVVLAAQPLAAPSQRVYTHVLQDWRILINGGRAKGGRDDSLEVKVHECPSEDGEAPDEPLIARGASFDDAWFAKGLETYAVHPWYPKPPPELEEEEEEQASSGSAKRARSS